jgi:hypothetical protein
MLIDGLTLGQDPFYERAMRDLVQFRRSVNEHIDTPAFKMRIDLFKARVSVEKTLFCVHNKEDVDITFRDLVPLDREPKRMALPAPNFLKVGASCTLIASISLVSIVNSYIIL